MRLLRDSSWSGLVWESSPISRIIWDKMWGQSTGFNLEGCSLVRLPSQSPSISTASHLLLLHLPATSRYHIASPIKICVQRGFRWIHFMPNSTTSVGCEIGLVWVWTFLCTRNTWTCFMMKENVLREAALNCSIVTLIWDNFDIPIFKVINRPCIAEAVPQTAS